MPNTPSLAHCHISGLAGGGMSALAWYLRFSGREVSGSDRAFDQGGQASQRAAFEAHGIRVTPQDGSGLTAAHTALVVSTAIEGGSPEIARARALNIPVLHRSELLAALASEKKTIAVAGTSGKSTVTGMLWHVLEAGGLAPSLITGANLPSLTERGLPGNAFAGTGPDEKGWLAIEADESDGSLVRYHPEVAVLLNIEKDHQEIDALMPLFRTFREQSKRAVIHQADPRCLSLAKPGDVFFDGRHGQEQAAGIPVVDPVHEEWESRFTWDGVPFVIPVPGRHNVENALAAIATGRLLGVSAEACARGLRAFRGVERRYVRVGEARGVTVVDDFAHNPAKVRAALETAKGSAFSKNRPLERRVLAIFHPHGFAPMKLIGRDMMESAATVLGPGDKLYLPEIYYAGGTADKSISSADLVAHLNAITGRETGVFLAAKDDVIAAVAAAAKPGDFVLSMGARDPSLGDFARRLLTALEAAPPA
jgi:UDP-N-acetylmuramate-alanine ligase